MLSRHPMEPVTHHDRTLAELVAERNGVIDQTSQLLNLSEEGHVFDHEPGYTDYHHDRDHHRHEYDRHVEFYETARYPHNLESSAASTNDLLHHEREQYYGRDQTPSPYLRQSCQVGRVWRTRRDCPVPHQAACSPRTCPAAPPPCAPD